MFISSVLLFHFPDRLRTPLFTKHLEVFSTRILLQIILKKIKKNFFLTFSLFNFFLVSTYFVICQCLILFYYSFIFCPFFYSLLYSFTESNTWWFIFFKCSCFKWENVTTAIKGVKLTWTICLGFFLQLAMTSTFPTTIPFFF